MTVHIGRRSKTRVLATQHSAPQKGATSRERSCGAQAPAAARPKAEKHRSRYQAHIFVGGRTIRSLMHRGTACFAISHSPLPPTRLHEQDHPETSPTRIISAPETEEQSMQRINY